MTDETKKLFDAPWKVYASNPACIRLVICSANGRIARDVETLTDANRIVCLPELYDALDKAAPYCPMWLTQEIVTLLKKVRDGE